MDRGIPQFYIPATSSLQERRPRTLKHGDNFAIFDHYGDVVGGPDDPEGLYYRDTRHLSVWRLSLAGLRPLLLSSTVQNDNALFNVDLTNPDLYDGGRIVLARDTLHIMRRKFLWQQACHETVAVRNYGRQPHTVELAFDFDADFADMFEVRGQSRERRGERSQQLRGRDAVVFVYRGLDGIERRTELVFHPAPDVLRPGSARFVMTLQPGQRAVLHADVRCSGERPESAARPRLIRRMREARRARIQASGRAAAVDTSHTVVNEVLCRGFADVVMLVSDTPHGPYPYAGIPWFCTPFGRDGILTAMQMLWLDPELARGALRFLAAHQAKAVDRAACAEPGKILHEMRESEMARLGEVPFGRYYGSVDATPLFVMLAGMYHRRTGDLATVRELWPNLRAALDWIDRYGDRDGDGFVEYASDPNGLANQGWRDSGDAVFHEDGTLASGPIALCEVQGYAYAAKRHGAHLARLLDEPQLAEALERSAADLQQRFEARFWMPDRNYYALALDGEKRACRVRCSSAGHLPLTGIVPPARAATLARTLLSREFFSGWGIRTIASGEARYNPVAYHNGSIWPHDNAIIAMGLTRYGHIAEAMAIFKGLFDAAAHMDLRRLPELFCGFHRHTERGPTHYPVACVPQAWASAAPFGLVAAVLGIDFSPAAGRVLFRHPRLPDSIEHVRIRNLRVGEGSIDVLLRRYGRDVAVNVLEKTGPLDAEVLL
ncbi:MAG TPA: amylo-alpha-1,6-glucosidase [Burkholderiales bacterium]|nr:amylo-alpha-1,6-glucosidase [Burkholderiales bacterium]